MSDLISYLSDVSAFAFFALGLATAIGWLRRREASLGWLALAIGLLSLVSLTGRVATLVSISSPAVTEMTVLALVGSAYALLRYRGSLIPLPGLWHGFAVAAMVAGTAGFVAAQILVANHASASQLETVAGIVLVLVWSAVVAEPTLRFWLLARTMPPVQAWRMRSLSLGFAGIVAILVFAIAAGTLVSTPVVQVVIQLLGIAIVPLLYVSFSPPSWLRRQWRSAEEEGLRSFMEELLVEEDRAVLTGRALEWAIRLVGGAAACMFDSAGGLQSSMGLGAGQLAQLQDSLDTLNLGTNRVELSGSQRNVLRLPVSALGSAGSLVVVAGPFTPAFGSEEVARLRQVTSAMVTALDRNRLLEQLRESNSRLVDANKHKSLFLASMSHELRTPLNAILGFSELLMDANNGQYPPATRKRFLDQINSSGRHLLDLINDILDLSKIEAGQMELRLQSVAITEVVQQVLSTIEPLASQKKIAIVAKDLDAGAITADQGKVRQMLLNLVSNAVKFTPEGGLVTIRAVRLDGKIELSVADTGIGIAQQDHVRIFQQFQQVDSTAARAQAGTGLGLTLTRRFAVLHGGDVRVESELGKGSVFTIVLPVEAHGVPAVVTPQFANGHDRRDARPMVLVVEDDPSAAELLCRQIERAGFQTRVARTGGEALAQAREQKPAAITLDILLPDLDGWEVLTRLKRDEVTSHIPVVIVSVVDNPELGIALGALDYFVKPVPARDLMNRLARFKFGNRTGDQVKILVVDDEDANREWLRRVLEPAGFAVVQAAGGKEAIQLARAIRPDLVLLDLMMPEVTGFDVVEALRADDTTRATPVMVLTAKTLTEQDIRQLNGHVSTILRRGTTGAADLLGLLRQVVSIEGVEAGTR